MHDLKNNLKVPSHQIRLGLKYYGWIGLSEYKDCKWKKDFLMLPSFFYFNLSSLSGIATCTALHAIRRFRRQYCSRSNSDKYTLLWYFLNFSSVFREILSGRGLFHVTATCKHLCYIVWKGYLPPFDSALKGIKFPFAACKKGLDTACKFQKIRENTRLIACGSRIPSCSLQKGS